MPNSNSIKIDFKNCYVRVYPAEQFLETVFPDGKKVCATPNDTVEYREAAMKHGYTDIWQYCLHHELLHTINAEVKGYEHSQTLRAVSEGVMGSYDEEGEIMDLQFMIMKLREYETRISSL